MRTSHIKIKQRILDEKIKITDEDFFASPDYAAYLTDIAAAVVHRYKRNVLVTTFWDQSPYAIGADTNGKQIRINCANEITQSFPLRSVRADSLLGLCGHELGHVLYTSFAMSNTYRTSMLGGTIYPKMPTKLSKTEAAALKELQALLQSDDKAAKLALLDVAHNLMNILEDVYIEERISSVYPGFRFGIELNNGRFAELVPPLREQVNNKDFDLSIMLNIMTQYALTHTVNNLDQYNGPYLDRFTPCIPIIDSCVYTSNAKMRYDAVNHILLLWWDYVTEYIQNIKNVVNQETAAKGGNLDDAETDAVIREVLAKLGQQVAKKPDNASSDRTAAVNESYRSDKETAEKNRQSVVDVIAQLFPSLPFEDSVDPGSDALSPLITKAMDYKGADYEKCASDIERMLDNMAKKRAYAILEREHQQSLSQEANSINYGPLHNNSRITIFRKSAVTDDDVRRYNQVAPKLLHLSKEMQKRVSQVIKDQGTGGKYGNLFMGRRLDARTVIRNDGRVFYNRKQPCSDAQIAVTYLIDESGSMRSGDRATMARATGIVIYDFCHGLHIPVSIIGHTSEQMENKSVELYSYADFQSIDNNDKYRLMDISARNMNRDGAAIRFAAEQLLKRPEPYKLLFVVSDGRPNSHGYSGAPAEQDMRCIIKDYSQKGIITFGVAIGSDRENIKRIYGKEFFLDVTDLNELPRNLTALISKYIKQTA